MAITFLSNQIDSGTSGDDIMIGNDPSGNTNDIIYGLQGNDTITFMEFLSDSTIYGGQGNDSINDNPTGNTAGGHNVIYGNFGDDNIFSNATGDTVYGGQGDDTVISASSQMGTIYGNLGNDIISATGDSMMNFYGGQGNDVVKDFGSNQDVIYGNFGNDFLIGEGTSDIHMYGGQGNDTLLFLGSDVGGTFKDVETGNLGSDLFVAEDTGGTNAMGIPQPITDVNDIVTVTDFLSGTDELAESIFAGIPLVKIAGSGDSAAQALSAANSVYNTVAHPSEYVFVYGGTGAGYLFYNGDSALVSGGLVHNNQTFATSGMTILGANTVSSVNLSDITTAPGIG